MVDFFYLYKIEFTAILLLFFIVSERAFRIIQIVFPKGK